MSPAARPSEGAVTLRCPFCLKLNRVAVARASDRPRCGSCSKPMLLDRPVNVSGEDLDRLVRDASVDVLVDFHADWCGPCKVMAPVLDELAAAHTGKLVVAKLDTDRYPEVSRRFDIRAIPTLILFRDGGIHTRHSGALSRTDLEKMLAGPGPK